MSGNTIEGLAQLGQIVREARGKNSYRRFAKEAGLSEATIKRIEDGMIKSPQDTTFAGLARACKRSHEELRAIARQEVTLATRQVTVAEDLIPLVNQLSNTEAARLAQYIVGRLGNLDTEVLNPSQENLRTLTNEQLSMVLRLVADRLQEL